MSITASSITASQKEIEQQFKDILKYQTYNAAPTFAGSVASSNAGIAKRNAMIAMRLRLPDGVALPFDFIATHETQEKVFVFIADGAKPLVIEDDPHLFPSDTLITQLRLIMNGPRYVRGDASKPVSTGVQQAGAGPLQGAGHTHGHTYRK